jgi:hypothetical protein
MSVHSGISGSFRSIVFVSRATRKHRRDVSAQLWSMA